MNNKKYSYIIHVYRGENRLLIIPVIRHESGLLVDSDWYVNMQEQDNYTKIGQGIVEAITVIEESPLSSDNLGEAVHVWAWQINSKYKTWGAFWKKNDYVRVWIDKETRNYEICSFIRSARTGINSGTAKEIILPADANGDEIGKAVVEAFDALDEYYITHNIGKRSFVKKIDLLDDSKMSLTPPKDRHFTDDEDASSAEIYQCYSYCPQEDAESSAEFFIGIAPELDCNLEASNVRAAWEDIYDEADSFEMQKVDYGIFKSRAEMKNKNSHRISYFLQMEEDLLLECGMDVHQPNRRKKLDEKLTKMFEEFAMSCKR